MSEEVPGQGLPRRSDKELKASREAPGLPGKHNKKSPRKLYRKPKAIEPPRKPWSFLGSTTRSQGGCPRASREALGLPRRPYEEPRLA